MLEPGFFRSCWDTICSLASPFKDIYCFLSCVGCCGILRTDQAGVGKAEIRKHACSSWRIIPHMAYPLGWWLKCCWFEWVFGMVSGSSQAETVFTTCWFSSSCKYQIHRVRVNAIPSRQSYPIQPSLSTSCQFSSGLIGNKVMIPFWVFPGQNSFVDTKHCTHCKIFVIEMLNSCKKA